MPFADPEEKKEYMRQWRREKIDKGYGKWLYDRRKLRFNDALRFREALTAITEEKDPGVMRRIAKKALKESRKAEEELGDFNTP